MAEVSGKLILEHLKALRADMSAMAADIANLKDGQAAQQTLLLGMMQSLTALSGNVATLEVRVGRIERRLELGS